MANGETISSFQVYDTEAILTLQQPKRSERKSIERYVLYNLLFIWDGKTEVQASLSCLCSPFLQRICLSPETVVFILSADRDTNDLTYFSHCIAAIALKTHSFGRHHHQQHSLKAGKGQTLQLDLHPHI